MTISILAYDPETGTYGGAAATGSLCVGGWVLRGDAESGLSASQGTAPSTLWGRAVLGRMRGGASASEAVVQVIGPDTGKEFRQLSALDMHGGIGHFTGAQSVPAASARTATGVVVAGNMLLSEAVLEACMQGYLAATGPLAERLLAALDAAAVAGGDTRGLASAALLCVGRGQAPLSLRIDWSDAPLLALRALYDRSQAQPYVGWTREVPTLAAPHRAPDSAEDVPEIIARAQP